MAGGDEISERTLVSGIQIRFADADGCKAFFNGFLIKALFDLRLFQMRALFKGLAPLKSPNLCSEGAGRWRGWCLTIAGGMKGAI